MEDIIIIVLLVIVLLIGIRSGIKHFKGEGSCCGGGSSEKVRRKRLKQVVKRRTVIIEGMTCEHCKNRVESRLNELAGVSARVNLKKKTALVSMEREVSDEQLRTAVEKAGYRVTDIF